MLNSIKVGNFIMNKRKELGMTQQQLADKLKVSFQAVSKWENGITYPNIEILYELAITLNVTVMDKMPQIKLEKIDGLTFIEQIMKPHTPYYKAIKEFFSNHFPFYLKNGL